jgi:predicted trehalose synthase
MVNRRRVGWAIGVLLLAIANRPARGTQQWSPTTKNLQVLDKGTSGKDLVSTMKGFTRALGVRCQHCHVYRGEDPDDLNAFDFASDEKTAKQTARTMIRMLSAINNVYLENVGDPPAAGSPKVTCYSCHRGEKRPLTERPDKQ